MPNRDGTGPNSKGAGTGKGLGPCGKSRGRDYGRGIGRGLGRKFEEVKKQEEVK